MKPARSSSLWLLLPAALLMICLLIVPVGFLLRLSFAKGGGQSSFGIGGGLYLPGTWTTQVYQQLLAESYFWQISAFTLFLGVAAMLLCLLLGYPTAIIIWQARGWVKGLMLCIVLIPKLASLLVTVYGLKLILGDYGPVNQMLNLLGITESPVILQNNLTGVIIGKTMLILPYTIFLLWAGLERIDRGLLEASRGLGASEFATFRLVTLPLSLPALATAGLVSFVWGLGAFVSPYLLGSPQEITLAVDIQRNMFENVNWPRAAAEGAAMLLMLGLTVSFLLLIAKWLGKGLFPYLTAKAQGGAG